MTVSVLVWLSVAAFLFVAIIVRINEDRKNSLRLRHSYSPSGNGKMKFIELGKEREEFFITGDPYKLSARDEYDSINE